MSSLSVPEHVHHGVAEHGGSVLLNLRSGQWYAMNPVADTLWRTWRGTGDFDAAITVVAKEYPRAPSQRIREDAQNLVTALMERGLVVLDDRTTPEPPSVDHEPPRAAVVVADAEPPTVRRRRTLSIVALVMALVLLRLPFRTTVGITKGLRNSYCRETATTTQLAGALAAVRNVSRWYPGRVACLEVSLAVVLVMALQRLKVDWVIGVADDPYRFHAWNEVAGIPVIGEYDIGFEQFRRILIA